MKHPPLSIAALIGTEFDALRLAGSVATESAPRFNACANFVPGPDTVPGLVLVAPPATFTEAADLARELRSRGRGWVVAYLSRDPGGGWAAQTVTAGYPLPVGEFLDRACGDSTVPLLELTTVLSTVSRARHDINNPLTSALAETQLLLMDATDPAVRDGLDAIQAQVRRIRDLVLQMGSLRTPD